MATKDNTEQILWMADCYSLAKRFPNPHTWLSLLEPVEMADVENLNPFHYWLWMEIWKAAQTNTPAPTAVGNASASTIPAGNFQGN
jgi:hypothetical protein